MSRRAACALLLLWTLSARAQDAPRPDLSGTWGLDKGRSRLQTPVPDLSVFYLDQWGDNFRLSRTHVVNGEPDTFTIQLTTDGKEKVLKETEETSFNRCYWEGDRLVYESRIERGKRTATNVVKYSLSPDGKTLTAEERFTGPVLKYENIWVFQREPQELDVTEADLAEIKATVLRYYETQKPERWEAFTEELQRRFIFPIEKGESPRIGIFTVEKKDDRLALIRQPPVGANMFYFGVFLAEHDGQWVVLEEYFEHERTNYKDPK